MNWRLKQRICEHPKFNIQANFAAALGLHQSFLSEVIRGRRQVTPEEQNRWAELLDCKVSDIFPEQAVDRQRSA